MGIGLRLLIGLVLALVPRGAVWAVPMTHDPGGFEGIPWGASFSETPEFVLVESSPRIKGYELRQGPPPLGTARVTSMRFLTVDGKFARVVIRYQGQDAHDRIVAYFERTFGPLDRTPGQLADVHVHQLNWRGPHTEINLTYEQRTERGTIFFEQYALADAFQEG
ncbi:hypothetical protein [Candidatus Nitrospira bockiana]